MKLIRASVALAAAIACPAALAAASAQASLSGLSFQLIDLNPNDGITPWISFAQGVRSEVQTSVSDPLGNQGSSEAALGVLANVSTSSTVSLAAASASSDPSTLIAACQALGLRPEMNGSGGSTFSAFASGIGLGWASNFTLSAHTLLVFSALGTVQSATTVGFDNWSTEAASAKVSLSVEGPGPDGGGGSQKISDSLDLTASYTYGPDANGNWGHQPQVLSLQDDVTVLFLNTSASSLSGVVSASVGVNGYSQVTAVPEPSGAALLLSGLGLLGWFGRRHTRR